MAEKPKRYHHGDLRRALVDAGLAILEEEGLAALTLRGVAARAGVSHAAPAHHFPTLKDLVTALATLAFERFHAAIEAGLAAAGPRPEDKVRGACAAYVGFATANPGLFRLMFSGEKLRPADPALQTAARAARTQLADFAAPMADELGLADPQDRVAFERLIWATVHGYAHLAVEGLMPADGREFPDFLRLLRR